MSDDIGVGDLVEWRPAEFNEDWRDDIIDMWFDRVTRIGVVRAPSVNGHLWVEQDWRSFCTRRDSLNVIIKRYDLLTSDPEGSPSSAPAALASDTESDSS